MAGTRDTRQVEVCALALAAAAGLMLTLGACAGPGEQRITPLPQATLTLEDRPVEAPAPLEPLPEVEGGGIAPEPLPRSRYYRRRGGERETLPPVSPLEKEARVRSELRPLEAESLFLDRRLERFDQGGYGSSRQRSLSYGPGSTRHDELIDQRLDLERRALDEQRGRAEDRLERQIYESTISGRPDAGQSPLERQLERLRQGPSR